MLNNTTELRAVVKEWDVRSCVKQKKFEVPGFVSQAHSTFYRYATKEVWQQKSNLILIIFTDKKYSYQRIKKKYGFSFEHLKLKSST